MASESALPYQMLDARAQSFACSIVIYTTRINDFFACRGLRLPRFDWQYSPPLSVTLVDRSLTCHSRCPASGAMDDVRFYCRSIVQGKECMDVQHPYLGVLNCNRLKLMYSFHLIGGFLS